MDSHGRMRGQSCPLRYHIKQADVVKPVCGTHKPLTNLVEATITLETGGSF